MSKSTPARTQLLKTLDETLRKVGAQSVLLSDTVAKLVGANPTDLECLDLLGLGGPTTAGRLAAHTGLTTGAMTAVIDRLERAGFARRLRSTEDRRSVLVEALPNRLARDRGALSAPGRFGGASQRGVRRPSTGRGGRLPVASGHARGRTRRLAADPTTVEVRGTGTTATTPAQVCCVGAGIRGHAGMSPRPARRGRLCRPRRLNICTKRSPGRIEPAMRDRRRMFPRAVGALWLFAMTTMPAFAQAPPPPTVPSGPLTLEQVLTLAEPRSEALVIAQQGIRRAEGEEVRARSGALPQLSATASYDRALASEFEGIFDTGTGTPCPPFMPNPAGHARRSCH